MKQICLNGDLIDVKSFCNVTDEVLEVYPYWTQIFIPETLIIPDLKPDIEQINSVKVEVEIIRKKVIITPTSDPIENQEGKILTGRKLIIEGQLCQTVTYTAQVPKQSVHTAHFIVPFSAFIVVPVLFGSVDALNVNFRINACVEDVFIKQVCSRQIFKNVTLLLHAQPAPLTECPSESCC